MIEIGLSATAANEYANRMPSDLPVGKLLHPGVISLTEAEAKALLADAEYNSDPAAFDVGEYDMPRVVRNAYRALAKRLRAVLTAA